jgi:hypothetical protein
MITNSQAIVNPVILYFRALIYLQILPEVADFPINHCVSLFCQIGKMHYLKGLHSLLNFRLLKKTQVMTL